MGLHDDVGFASKATVGAVEMEPRHAELAGGVGGRAGVRAGEHFKVLELDAL